MTGRRILVVDDEPDIREVASLALEAVGGHEVLQAGSGTDGIAIAAAEHPDAIVLDVMMPGLDGPATFRALQASDATRDIPVVLLTAKAAAGDRRAFERLGVRGVLTKPFDPMLLGQDLADVLGWTP